MCTESSVSLLSKEKKGTFLSLIEDFWLNFKYKKVEKVRALLKIKILPSFNQ